MCICTSCTVQISFTGENSMAMKFNNDKNHQTTIQN